MEKPEKVLAKLAELKSQDGVDWSAAYNSVTQINQKGEVEQIIKTFISPPTGEVKEFLHADFE